MDEDIEKLSEKKEGPRTEEDIRQTIEMCIKCLKKIPEVEEKDGMSAEVLEQMFTTTLANEQNELIKLLEADIAELNAKIYSEQLNLIKIEENTAKTLVEFESRLKAIEDEG